MESILSAFADEAHNKLEGQIEALSAVGIRFLDLRSIDGHNIAALPRDAARAAKEKLDAAGIAVNMFGSPIGKIDIGEPFEPELAKLEHLADMADVFGCRRVRMFSYFNKQGKLESEWRSIALDRLAQLRRRAATLGLALYHENERFIFGESAANNAAIAESLRDGEVFCTIFDFDNYHRGGEDPWAAYQTMKPFTDAIHLKDSQEDGEHVPVGFGAGKVREILADMVASGWAGPLSVEPHMRMSKATVPPLDRDGPPRRLCDITARECFDTAGLAAKRLLDEIELVHR